MSFRPCDGTISVFRHNPKVFNVLSHDCESRAWIIHCGWSENQHYALCGDIEVVGLRNVLQCFLGQRHLVLRRLFREHDHLIKEVRASYFTASWQGEVHEQC